MKFLTKESILNAKDLNITEVEVPEWDGYIYLRALTGEEGNNLIEIYSSDGTPEEKTNRAKEEILRLSICDETGDNLFTKDDIKDLQKKNREVLTRIFLKAQDLSGLSQKKIEAIEKNL